MVEPDAAEHAPVELVRHVVPPPPRQVREQIDRLAAHPIFARSAASLKLLRFFASTMLSAGGKPVSQRVVADVLLGLTEEFRPTENPLVRMQVGRLRKKLQEYYAGEGARDPIVVSLPKGRYCLAAEWRAAAEPDLDPLHATGSAASHSAIGSLADGIDPGAANRPPARPVVLISELDGPGLGPDFELLPECTTTLLVPNLLGNGRFWAIGPLSRQRAEDEGVGYETACVRFHADYLLLGQLALEGTHLSVALQMVPRLGIEPVWTAWCSEDLAALPERFPDGGPGAGSRSAAGFGPRVALVGQILAGRITVALCDAIHPAGEG
jgi:hypothetical protein